MFLTVISFRFPFSSRNIPLPPASFNSPSSIVTVSMFKVAETFPKIEKTLVSIRVDDYSNITEFISSEVVSAAVLKRKRR